MSASCSRFARIFSLSVSASLRAAAIFSWMSAAVDMTAGSLRRGCWRWKCEVGRVSWNDGCVSRRRERMRTAREQRRRTKDGGERERDAERRGSARGLALGRGRATRTRGWLSGGWLDSRGARAVGSGQRGWMRGARVGREREGGRGVEGQRAGEEGGQGVVRSVEGASAACRRGSTRVERGTGAETTRAEGAGEGARRWGLLLPLL